MKGPGEEAAVLLVDDRPARLDALEAALSGLGDDVVFVRANSGSEALRCLLDRDFAAILLDVHMPIMDGFETASLIRKRERSERTPILFVTALAPGEAQVPRGYALGAVDFVFSPVLPEVLRSKVTVFLDLHRKTVQSHRQAEWLRAEAERRAVLLETRLRGLTDRLEVGVFRATPEGRLLEANRAFLALLGSRAAETVSAGLLRRLLPPAGEEHGTPRDLEVSLADGTVRWLTVTSSPGRAAGGEEIVDGILEDISARKRDEQALRRAHADLEAQARLLAKSNGDLQRFAHVISHDLQEPLRMVNAFTDILSRQWRDRLEPESREFLDGARTGAARMRAMIHGLLEFFILEQTEERLRPTDAGESLEGALANLRLAIRDAGAEITRERLPTVQADGLLLTHVLQNLVANAVKFRREGVAPRVHVGAERQGSEWAFTVRDNGIGIPEEAKDQLFGILRRLPGSENYPGTGIGLALCKRIVERHRGRIWAEAAEGGGTAFRFTLPAAAGGIRRRPAAAAGAAMEGNP